MGEHAELAEELEALSQQTEAKTTEGASVSNMSVSDNDGNIVQLGEDPEGMTTK